jgi:hypothetical protein
MLIYHLLGVSNKIRYNIFESLPSLVSLYCITYELIDIKVRSKGTRTSSGLENQKKIAPIFMSNGLSATVIIPIELARKYAIDKPSHVTIVDTQNGILIKKLGVKD